MININQFKSIAVLGNTGSGKTALVFKLLEQANRPVYFIKYPKPELLAQFNYNNLASIDAISRLSNCIIYFDEPQLYTNCAEYKRDMLLVKILSLARQRNITFIVSSADTRTFGKRVEAFIDLWLIKDVEFGMCKQRSMVRQILQDNAIVTPEEISLQKHEFLAHNRTFLELNGRHTFTLIDKWSEALSKPYLFGMPNYSETQKLTENSQKTHEKLTEKTDTKNSQKILTQNTMENMELTIQEIGMPNNMPNIQSHQEKIILSAPDDAHSTQIYTNERGLNDK